MVDPIGAPAIAIAQFGTIAPIPEDLLDGNYKLEFYPTTGAKKHS